MSKNEYFIECRLKTLLQNAVRDGAEDNSFSVDGYFIRHSEFNYRDGWVDDYWIVQKELVASTYQDALISFYTDLDKIVSKIEFIGQTYCGYPFLSPTIVCRRNYKDDFAFFRLVIEHKSGGLMFTDKQKKALDVLMQGEHIPENFYKYWSAATKTKDYSAKLLVMLSAVEALVRVDGKLDHELRKEILGSELDDALFKQKTGLRHQLSHGEHLSGVSSSKADYSALLHSRIISYFNTVLFKEELLSTNVVSPQRTDFENFRAGNTFIRTKDSSRVGDVKSVLESLEDDSFKSESIYTYDYSDDRENY
jgi:hypothetical protein